MPLLAISILSAGVIACELVLMRLYSIVQWHHFAFMIISIALLATARAGRSSLLRATGSCSASSSRGALLRTA